MFSLLLMKFCGTSLVLLLFFLAPGVMHRVCFSPLFEPQNILHTKNPNQPSYFLLLFSEQVISFHNSIPLQQSFHETRVRLVVELFKCVLFALLALMCRQGCSGSAGGEEESEYTCPLTANRLVQEILNAPHSRGLLPELGKACRIAKRQRIDWKLGTSCITVKMLKDLQQIQLNENVFRGGLTLIFSYPQEKKCSRAGV